MAGQYLVRTATRRATIKRDNIASQATGDVAAAIRLMIARETASMGTLAAATPKVLDGHSDGKRVRYVRHETRAAVLTEVLAMLTDGAE